MASRAENLKKHGRYLTKAHSYRVEVFNVFCNGKPYPGKWTLLLVLEGLAVKKTARTIKLHMEKITKCKKVVFEYKVIT